VVTAAVHKDYSVVIVVRLASEVYQHSKNNDIVQKRLFKAQFSKRRINSNMTVSARLLFMKVGISTQAPKAGPTSETPSHRSSFHEVGAIAEK
jgi:hypothetical protein